MGSFHIQTVDDPESGHVRAEIRREADGYVIAESGPVFASHDEAEARLVEAISRAWPQVPVDPVYPANGS